MDIIDTANDQAERLLDAARARREPAGPVANGACHYCGQAVADGLRWCDPECHHAWNDEQDLLRRTGRKHPGRG
ncbi:hypothetical protein THICB3320756 [Thiomonas sp. CB3]|nr:hypothetical protein THICB3320756 [Thiomonas sp. CB3]